MEGKAQPHSLPVLPRLGILLAIALVLGTLAQILRPNPLPWLQDHRQDILVRALHERLPTVSAEQVLHRIERGDHLLLDARAPEEVEAGRLPGAISFPFAEKEILFADYAPLLGAEQPIIVYCSGEKCEDAFLLSLFLRDNGCENIVLFAGGIEAWKKEGFPVE